MTDLKNNPQLRQTAVGRSVLSPFQFLFSLPHRLSWKHFTTFNSTSLLHNILVDKYKFVLDKNHDGFLEYNHILGNGSYIQVQNFEKEHIFSLIYFLYGKKIVVANRYKCNTIAELEFFLLKGRWGDYFQAMK